MSNGDRDLEDRRRDRIVSVPNIVAALGVALTSFVLAALYGLTGKVSTIEANQRLLLDWRTGYASSPWTDAANIERWIADQDRRLNDLELRVLELEPQRQ